MSYAEMIWYTYSDDIVWYNTICVMFVDMVRQIVSNNSFQRYELTISESVSGRLKVERITCKVDNGVI